MDFLKDIKKPKNKSEEYKELIERCILRKDEIMIILKEYTTNELIQDYDPEQIQLLFTIYDLCVTLKINLQYKNKEYSNEKSQNLIGMQGKLKTITNSINALRQSIDPDFEIVDDNSNDTMTNIRDIFRSGKKMEQGTFKKADQSKELKEDYDKYKKDQTGKGIQTNEILSFEEWKKIRSGKEDIIVQMKDRLYNKLEKYLKNKDYKQIIEEKQKILLAEHRKEQSKEVIEKHLKEYKEIEGIKIYLYFANELFTYIFAVVANATAKLVDDQFNITNEILDKMPDKNNEQSKRVSAATTTYKSRSKRRPVQKPGAPTPPGPSRPTGRTRLAAARGKGR